MNEGLSKIETQSLTLTESNKKARRRKSPKVGEFQKNIYNEEYFSETVMSDYFDAFYDGYSMQLYSFAEDCQEHGRDLMDQLYEFNLNMTRRRSPLDPYYLITHTIGEELNDSWFYCYQFGHDIYTEYATKAENFVDFGDVYLSFIFNLLSNSLNIKSSTEKMIDARKTYDTELFIENLAKILRITFDFDSYQTVAGSIKTLVTKPEDFFSSYVPTMPGPTKRERENKRREEIRIARENLEAKKAGKHK